MAAVLRGLGILALLSVPVIVMLNLPRLFDMVAPAPTTSTSPGGLTSPRPAQREPLIPPRKPASTPDTAPPTTQAAAVSTATPAARPPTPTVPSERAVVTNTGGIGAVVRAEPVSGPQVGSLREQVIVSVLERRSVNGTEWVRVRSEQGVEGWVIGVVVRPAPG
jgi:hypothetical protein